MRGDLLSRWFASPCQPDELSFPDHRRKPANRCFIVESIDPLGPFGAKEAGEGALSGFPPALVNAVADALGMDVNFLPVTPDRVLQALIKHRRALRKKEAKS